MECSVYARRWDVSVEAELLEIFPGLAHFQWRLRPSASRVVALLAEGGLVAG